ncbi:MAG: hypothetical protein ABIS39_01670 [Sphingomicrobium sp.]
MTRRFEWFAPKRIGYGFSFPIAWQGWAVFFAYVVLLYLATIYLDPPSIPFWVAVIAATVMFVTIAYFTTRGGWRYRWGEDD